MHKHQWFEGMKLRIKGDSIRLRLTPAEVTQLQEIGYVEEVTHFGPEQVFVYAIRLTQNVVSLGARFNGETLIVEMPQSWIEEWAQSDKVGFEETQPVGDNLSISILVEKDFHFMQKQ